jgi:hypothetical protein
VQAVYTLCFLAIGRFYTMIKSQQSKKVTLAFSWCIFISLNYFTLQNPPLAALNLPSSDKSAIIFSLLFLQK